MVQVEPRTSNHATDSHTSGPVKPASYQPTVMILSFRTDMPGQTVQTQIRLLLEERSSLIRVYTVCHSVCIAWTHYSMVKPHSSNFRVITTNFLGVRKLRIITVLSATCFCTLSIRTIMVFVLISVLTFNIIFWLVKF